MRSKTIILGIVLIAAGAVIIWSRLYPASSDALLGRQKDGENPATDSAAQTVGKEIKYDFSGKGLEKIPSHIFMRTEMTELDVSRNALTGALPAEIGQLQNLRVLKAGDNKMTGIPAEVGRLSKLETLDFSNNRITGLPMELGDLKALKTLNLTGNPYSKQDLDAIRAKLPDTQFIVD